MGSEMKVEIIHKETIKPSSPTPPHLTSCNLSVFDQLTPEMHTQLVLFYPRSSDEANNIDHHSLVAERSNLLKKSLSEALTQFYVFAGEFKYNVSISCNDQGAAFVEAKVNCPMSKIFERPDVGMHKQLLPNSMEHRTQSGTGYLLLVQANFFVCGGLAIGIAILHKVADASTTSRFIKSWAAIALGSSTTSDVERALEFGAAASLFPPLDFLNSPDKPSMEFVQESCVTRRFVFNAPKIADLKIKAASSTVPNPTRVEVVSALIWKSAMEASKLKLGFVRPSMWCQIVNMRNILVQPSAEDILGNVLGYFVARTVESDEDHDDLQSLVAKLRKGFEEFKVRYANGIKGEDVFQFSMEFVKCIQKEDMDSYCNSSWCRFPFHSANFGWGRPSWMDIPGNGEMKNTMMLVDVSDCTGIEVHVTLKEENMAFLETNQELLAYASLNPSIIL